MEFALKSLSPDAVPRAIAKAERYRLLNEPAEAESICLDALDVDPQNQEALATLLLALTDQFDDDTLCTAESCVAEAWRTVARLHDDYERAYFTGIVYERRAKAQLRHRTLGGGPQAYEWLREAMSWYEKAEAIRPTSNDDAVLRWNACARLIMRDHHLVPRGEERGEPLLLE
jgi:tetratricopeptide (TPR) repeat protein